MRGVIYARYSEGPRQTDQSIEGQVDDCTAYAKSKGIDIIEIYADRHISGKSVDGRDEFQRMMHDADQKKFDAVIVWKIDRFGRNREDIAVNKIRLRKAGVQLMYAKESVPDGPEGILLESLLEGLAEYYSADLRQKVIRGQIESAKKGKWVVGQLPIGYRRDPEKRIVLDENEAGAIREIFRLHIADASLEEMRGVLASHGILDSKGRVPVKSVIYRILKNRHYLGEFELRGVPVPAPAIIDQATFDEAQKHFKGSTMNGSGKAKTEYLLSCKCHCAYCGSLLIGESGRSKTGRIYYYYKCGGQKRGHECELKPIRQDVLEDAVIRHTVEDVLTDEMIEMLTAKIMELQEKEAAEDPATQLRERLKNNQRHQENLLNALETNGSRILAERLQQLEQEADELSIEISKAEIRHPIIPEDVVRGWLLSFRKGDKDDPAFRKKLIETFVSDVIVKNEEIIIFYNIEKEPHSKCSNTARLVDPRGLEPRTDRL